MANNIAVIVSCDTKENEALFVCEKVAAHECEPILVDISCSGKACDKASIKPFEIVDGLLPTGKTLSDISKSEAINTMAQGLKHTLKMLYQNEKIDGVIGMGGLQNTEICTAAMRELPLGFPKVMVSTVASGRRYFASVVGKSDIVTIPSIVDFNGINRVSSVILSSAVAAICAMAKEKQEICWAGPCKVIASTMMGVTNDTVVRASQLMKDKGFEVLSFHSTGAGGATLEGMAKAGRLDGIMDLSLQEMTAEYFGGYGFSAGANERLNGAAQAGIPMVVCPGAIDFICLRKNELFDDSEKRGMVWHNSDLAHVRLYDNEVLDIVRTICSRVNSSSGRVSVLLPRKGLRTLSEPGQVFYRPELMEKIEMLFKELLSGGIVFKAFDMGFTDSEFALIAANEMESLLQ